MNDKYTISCTKAQTKKSIELGASWQRYKSIPTFAEVIEITISEYYEIPTAEQMLGWLEVQGLTFEVIMACKKIAYFTLWRIDNKGAHPIIGRSDSDYPSRKSATIAAIDSALEYLITNNKK